MGNNYQPQQFSELFKTHLGQAIWAFLNEPNTILRMETATYLGRPALEAVIPSLRQRFGDAAFDDNVKRMTGHMVRQILEAIGYRLDRMGVRITAEDNGFTTAARYVSATSRYNRIDHTNPDEGGGEGSATAQPKDNR